jgi:hypothetical protein
LCDVIGGGVRALVYSFAGVWVARWPLQSFKAPPKGRALAPAAVRAIVPGVADARSSLSVARAVAAAVARAGRRRRRRGAAAVCAIVPGVAGARSSLRVARALTAAVARAGRRGRRGRRGAYNKGFFITTQPNPHNLFHNPTPRTQPPQPIPQPNPHNLFHNPTPTTYSTTQPPQLNPHNPTPRTQPPQPIPQPNPHNSTHRTRKNNKKESLGKAWTTLIIIQSPRTPPRTPQPPPRTPQPPPRTPQPPRPRSYSCCLRSQHARHLRRWPTPRAARRGGSRRTTRACE